MRSAASTLFLMLLIAGCAESADPLAEPDAAGPDAADTTELGAADWVGLREFHWVRHEAAVGLAIESQWDFGAENMCEFTMAHGGAEGEGPAAVMMRRGPTNEGWSSSPSYNTAWVRADGNGGGLQEGRGIEGWVVTGGGTDGVMTVTWLLADVQPGADFVRDGAAFAFSIECEQPFTHVGAKAGRIGAIEAGAPRTGGTGAGIHVDGNSAPGFLIGGTLAAEIDAPHARCGAGSYSDEVMRITLQAPSGTVQWDFLPQVGERGIAVHEDGPGNYTMSIDYAGQSRIWAGIWGLDGDFDLGEGRVETSAAQVPV